MSHFTVLVVGDDVEGQLERYDENGGFTEFVDCTDELIQDFNALDDEDKTTYRTLEQYAEEYCGYRARQNFDGKTRFGYVTNPNAKWDWYVVGGRWTGFFKLKPGATTGQLGEPGVFGNQAPEGTADIAEKGDIDWAAMRKEAEDYAAKHYDELAAIAAQHPPFKGFDELRESSISIEAARTDYWAQPAIAAMSKADVLGWGERPEEILGLTRAKYIKRCGKRNIATYAVVMNNEWHAKGDMGWWGISSNDKDDWPDQFWRLIKSLPDHTMLTLVDCHI